MDYDEYPFKTTSQGSFACGCHNYSVRMISAKDNQLAGSRASVWFGRDRTLSEDKAYLTFGP